ncbi:single-pass membrane and coiled-coil domain-containing protein 1 [Patagioenas fasciata monilis]|uniref:Single-pass membrane and coiled-coil domain-containing protein 1 n=1 Tax=Patagioenas fasciata monilis TaxID=372326 RepID=A0A1V4KQR6_PATFA|nr:single-pass membrane and coiled-coil domain-containing protein 1 [Patagioenas fasciata monilis]
MAKASISLHSLKETLNRVETKLQTVEAQFGDLDSSLQELAQKFELLEKELGQDTSWTRVLGERLGSEEERQPGRRERLVSEGRAGAARRPPLREPAALPAAGAVPVTAAGPGSCSSSQTKEQGRTSSAAQESFISPSERGAESVTEAAFEGHAYTEKLAGWKVKSELSDTELAEWKVKVLMLC